jgi:tRNA U34 5-methylaminomethyl-2-thiouridine-forming methyltransferase MnmC
MYEFKLTHDGSSTLYSKQFNETYHSIFGAISESNHIYIKNGIQYYKDFFQINAINILEIGFGTGLNAILTWKYACENNIRVQYFSVEKYPLSIQEIQNLNYSDILQAPWQERFKTLHTFEWNKSNVIKDFKICKLKADLLNLPKMNTVFDIIYFDAFSPEKQPELWTEQVFENLFALMKKNGILVSYCAKGLVKRNLKKVGFTLQTPPGALRKREMIRAVKL